jgi:hypothetical protein
MENHIKYSKGVSWVADCRIPFVNEGDIPNDMDKTHLDGRNFYTQVYNGFMYQQNPQGRFTPNLLVCDDMLNDGSISKAGDYKGEGSKSGGIWNNSTGKPAGVEYGDKGSNSRYYDLDLWFDKILERL